MPFTAWNTSQLLDMAYDATSTESKGEKNSGFLNPNFM